MVYVVTHEFLLHRGFEFRCRLFVLFFINRIVNFKCNLYVIFSCFLAENVAKRWNVTREDQDNFALMSQRQCETARQNGLFDAEIVPVPVMSRQGRIISVVIIITSYGSNLSNLND